MSATFQEIVEVPFDSVRELKKGLVTHRNKFCDVRLWVENHAIPAHKLILSLHSTFFEQMFKSEPESASEVYLNGVRYNVLYPIIEFMYTGRAHIESMDAFDEIKVFSRNINFQPFSTLWNDNAPAIMTSPLCTPAPNICFSPVPASMSCNNIASTTTQMTSYFPATQTSSNLAPALSSTPVLNNSVSHISFSPSPLPRRLSDLAILDDSRYIPTTPTRANFASTSASNSDIVPPTPPRQSHSSSLFQLSTAPTVHDFLGFSPQDVADSFRRGQVSYSRHVAPQATNCNVSLLISPQTKNPVEPNSVDSIIELSEISQPERMNDCNNNEVIEIDETEVEIVPQMAISNPIGNKMSRGGKKSTNSKNEIGTKPKPGRGRPKKVNDVTDAKLYVSPNSLFKKTKPSQRGRKSKTSLI